MIEEIKSIHFVGIGGVGMGTLARALSEKGYRVTGSDTALYEPMKSVLTSAKIDLTEGYSQNISQGLKPDLVVVGNVVRRDNPEVKAWLQSEVRFLSFPEAIRRFLIGEKKSIVCAGTHGKTTTTSWIAYCLTQIGLKPSYLIGGVPLDLPHGCLFGDGDIFVGEGDEYDSAFFDKGPKFLHYSPDFLVLTSIEFDHADIYRDLAHVRSAFEKLIYLLPGDGLCIARFEDPVVMGVVSDALCPVQTFGVSGGSMWRLGKIEEDEKGFQFEAIYKGRSLGTFRTPLFGEHNLLNLLSGIVCTVNLGVSIEKVRPIVETFRGARRRQEILLVEPVLLIDDFAHHPTEVAATLKAVRRRFPSRKIWALFEPRSATARRKVHQQAYANAFDSADQILVSSSHRQGELNESERFSCDDLVSSLHTQNKQAHAFTSVDEMVGHFTSQYGQGDIVVVMSNGEFDKIQEKILRALR